MQNPGTTISVAYQRVPYAKKGRHAHEFKVNDVAKCYKINEVFTLVK